MSADTFSDGLSSVYSSVLEDDSSSEYSSDSDDVNFRAVKRQKTLVIDSDTESGYETHWCWGMHSPLPLLKSSLKTVFHEN